MSQAANRFKFSFERLLDTLQVEVQRAEAGATSKISHARKALFDRYAARTREVEFLRKTLMWYERFVPQYSATAAAALAYKPFDHDGEPVTETVEPVLPSCTPPWNLVKEGTTKMTEVYNSSTLGPIPLSFTGRHLMQNLREALAKHVDYAMRCARIGQEVSSSSWEPVSEARGRIAQYMNKLENKRIQYMTWRDPVPLETLERALGAAKGEISRQYISQVSNSELIAEITRRLRSGEIA